MSLNKETKPNQSIINPSIFPGIVQVRTYQAQLLKSIMNPFAKG